MTTTTLGDLLARADDLCRELRDNPDPVRLNVWESFDATAYVLIRELVGPARTDDRAFTPSRAALCRVLDAYPALLRSATTGPLGAERQHTCSADHDRLSSRASGVGRSP